MLLTAAVLSVHRVGHKGCSDNELFSSFCICTNFVKHLGDSLIKLQSSCTKDSESLITLACLPHSCQQRLMECAIQGTNKDLGSSFLNNAATPFKWPAMFAAPSYTCPRQLDKGNAHRVRQSWITLFKVVASVASTWSRPIKSSNTS